MMLILIVMLKLESVVKSIASDNVIILKTMKTLNYKCLGDGVKYVA